MFMAEGRKQKRRRGERRGCDEYFRFAEWYLFCENSNKQRNCYEKNNKILNLYSESLNFKH